MARSKRTPGRNRNGGYDLTSANQAQPARGRSRYDSGSIRAGSHSSRAESGRSSSRGGSRGRSGALRPQGERQPDYFGRNQRRSNQYVEGYEAAARRAHDTASFSSASSSRSSRRQGRLGRGSSRSSRQSAQSASRSGQQPRLDDAQGRYSAPRDGAQSYAPSRYHARKKSKRGKRAAIIAVAAVAIVLAGVGIAAASWYNNIASNLRGDQNISATTAAAADQPYYVLLLGGDSRADQKTDNRTDSIMVARVDEKNQQVSLLSVPRDTRVAISGHGYQKINAAIEFGGYDAVINELNELMGIQINYYAFIYFDGFKDLVDKLGGVTVSTVPEGTEYQGVKVPAGKNVTINGEQALVLARCRHGVPADQGAYAMGDYQRTLNQRNLIKAIAKKVLASSATDLPNLITGLSECIETNMDVSKILSVAQNMKGMDVDSMKAASLPYGSATIDGAWYAILFKDVTDDVLANFRNGKGPYSGLGGYQTECNGDDLGTDYTDGTVYSYALYENIYGPYKSTSSSSSSSSTATSGSSSASESDAT